MCSHLFHMCDHIRSVAMFHICFAIVVGGCHAIAAAIACSTVAKCRWMVNMYNVSVSSSFEG